ncbi:hypothetical protein MPTK1_6g04190 [Marchantia polymorpha subsp. ruderalis]|nr:hypothetical protein MARPO_0034s0099 [Marchantia polymorpha]BBN13522.1 hypothetical protein Mp_6g04190 [Marchantia polymorpha subsp. ruderalis]|eukprot:PTQ41517.1 hypothetical protein MARPO_0034s0099 [Marchantia polymorpha]
MGQQWTSAARHVYGSRADLRTLIHISKHPRTVRTAAPYELREEMMVVQATATISCPDVCVSRSEDPGFEASPSVPRQPLTRSEEPH